MLLQTLVQLNILILATPALAGWSVLPPVHAGMAGTVGIVWQFRAAEASAPKANAPAKVRQPAAVSLCAALVQTRYPAAPIASQPAATFASISPFPHAARAP